MVDKNRVLLTGAAGNIGSKLRLGLRARYELVLLDRISDPEADIQYANFEEYDQAWIRYFEGVSAVIHLAGNPSVDASWKDLVPDNIDSLLNVCQACVEKGVKRLVFASSCHTMGGYRELDIYPITTEMEPLPDSPYGVSKLVGERICRSFARKYRISCICLRIGWVPRKRIYLSRVHDAWLKTLWISDRDLVQVFQRSVEASYIGYGVFYALSSNQGARWDLEATMRRLEYVSQDGLG